MVYIIIGILLILALFLGGTYNSFVKLRNTVEEAFATMDVYLKKRYDLIPNLVSTVQGVANFERETYTAVTEARAKVGQIKLSADQLSNPQAFQQFQQAQDGLSSALSRLLVVSENYPQLKANENFLQLQAQLEGTENRISVERMKYNQVVQDYNTQIKRFPAAFIASMTGFKEKEYFRAVTGAEEAPRVQF